MEQTAMNGAPENSLEFRLLAAYVKKRRPSLPVRPGPPGASAAPQPASGRKWKGRIGKLKMFFLCIRPQKEDHALRSQPSETDGRGPCFRARGPDRSASAAGTVLAVTDKLTAIADSVPMDPDEYQADGPDDVIDSIVELLRVSGDRLNEEMKENESLSKLLGGGFSYSTFKKVTSAFLGKVDPADIPSSKDPEQAMVALTFEVTSRLTTMDCHPMNVVMGFGARYLQENYSGWVKQHGGWEKAFATEDDEEVQ
ncbi:apoptosis facilitator Bcl-2-like protein 14 isoform X1 [Conger conger]|uniref:apoptosis facilitator Bcl-2-like protein 14 isoform X1 n=1 Tax=Conger conger TaxID=82655 RepID=UPI002A5987EA|nr:apoptosis facilitator Bcl-2-like protein 14 isoform X1 [Conger conger]